ncbi:hypothetical protein VTN00DRAFT_4940 [Thermoascus crustaceus]|uniref:uncharacterized protein n=1 Tax=Thermoascus crustaceus TaxID=5088 RepID=UPI003743B33E
MLGTGWESKSDSHGNYGTGIEPLWDPEFRPNAPILNKIKIPLIDTQVQGDPFPSENPLLCCLEPCPAADELWQDFEIQRPFVLSREQVLALGKDPDKTVKYLPDEDFGLGNDACMAGMDAFHVLSTQSGRRPLGITTSMPQRRHTELWCLHLWHCTEIDVQFIMFHADATMTTMVWLETQERPWPDFSVNRKCVDFDALVRWRDEHALNVAKAGMVRRPAVWGFQEMKISEMYWRPMGNETMPGDNWHHPLWD